MPAPSPCRKGCRSWSSSPWTAWAAPKLWRARRCAWTERPPRPAWTWLDQADLHITVTRLVMLALMAGMLAALAVSMLPLSQFLMVVTGAVADSVAVQHV